MFRAFITVRTAPEICQIASSSPAVTQNSCRELLTVSSISVKAAVETLASICGGEVAGPDLLEGQEAQQRGGDEQERHERRQHLEGDGARVREEVVLDVGGDDCPQPDALPDLVAEAHGCSVSPEARLR